MLPGARAESEAADATPFVLERNDDGVFLSTTVSFELPSVVDDVLRKGIPVHFVAEADLLRDRWYWTDKRVARTTRHMRLAYQTLVRRWKLQVGSTPIGNNGLGVTLSQNFESLGDALTAIQRFSRWRIASASDIDPDANTTQTSASGWMSRSCRDLFRLVWLAKTEWSIAYLATKSS
ncbi:MAG: DUF4390 domain-containing protein [Betaproteobacteria bacterium]|nr:DUF4390 domain-containing protein [Betaproteobacteria bacterium]